MLHHTGQILYNILLPLLLMVSLGTLLQRYQPLSVGTLARVSHVAAGAVVPVDQDL